MLCIVLVRVNLCCFFYASLRYAVISLRSMIDLYSLRSFQSNILLMVKIHYLWIIDYLDIRLCLIVLFKQINFQFEYALDNMYYVV